MINSLETLLQHHRKKQHEQQAANNAGSARVFPPPHPLHDGFEEEPDLDQILVTSRPHRRPPPPPTPTRKRHAVAEPYSNFDDPWARGGNHGGRRRHDDRRRPPPPTDFEDFDDEVGGGMPDHFPPLDPLDDDMQDFDGVGDDIDMSRMSLAPRAPPAPPAPPATATETQAPTPQILPLNNIKGRGLVFGLNYTTTSMALNGCVNDAHGMGDLIRNRLGFPCDVYTDDNEAGAANTTALGFTGRMHELAIKTFTENLDVAYIHYSGHGDSVPENATYGRRRPPQIRLPPDTAGGQGVEEEEDEDEEDGKDEALIPSDFGVSGQAITDDIIFEIIRQMNPKTQVVIVFDCCHSGTMADLPYTWTSDGMMRADRYSKPTNAKVLTISACTDAQVALDVYNLRNDYQYRGALTTSLIDVITRDPKLCDDVFALLRAIEATLRQHRFPQTTTLSSSYDLSKDRAFLNCKMV